MNSGSTIFSCTITFIPSRAWEALFPVFSLYRIPNQPIDVGSVYVVSQLLIRQRINVIDSILLIHHSLDSVHCRLYS